MSKGETRPRVLRTIVCEEPNLPEPSFNGSTPNTSLDTWNTLVNGSSYISVEQNRKQDGRSITSIVSNKEKDVTRIESNLVVSSSEKAISENYILTDMDLDDTQVKHEIIEHEIVVSPPASPESSGEDSNLAWDMRPLIIDDDGIKIFESEYFDTRILENIIPLPGVLNDENDAKKKACNYERKIYKVESDKQCMLKSKPHNQEADRSSYSTENCSKEYFGRTKDCEKVKVRKTDNSLRISNSMIVRNLKSKLTDDMNVISVTPGVKVDKEGFSSKRQSIGSNVFLKDYKQSDYNLLDKQYSSDSDVEIILVEHPNDRKVADEDIIVIEDSPKKKYSNKIENSSTDGVPTGQRRKSDGLFVKSFRKSEPGDKTEAEGKSGINQRYRKSLQECEEKDTERKVWITESSIERGRSPDKYRRNKERVRSPNIPRSSQERGGYFDISKSSRERGSSPKYSRISEHMGISNKSRSSEESGRFSQNSRIKKERSPINSRISEEWGRSYVSRNSRERERSPKHSKIRKDREISNSSRSNGERERSPHNSRIKKERSPINSRISKEWVRSYRERGWPPNKVRINEERRRSPKSSRRSRERDKPPINSKSNKERRSPNSLRSSKERGRSKDNSSRDKGRRSSPNNLRSNKESEKSRDCKERERYENSRSSNDRRGSPDICRSNRERGMSPFKASDSKCPQNIRYSREKHDSPRKNKRTREDSDGNESPTRSVGTRYKKRSCESQPNTSGRRTEKSTYSEYNISPGRRSPGRAKRIEKSPIGDFQPKRRRQISPVKSPTKHHSKEGNDSANRIYLNSSSYRSNEPSSYWNKDNSKENSNKKPYKCSCQFNCISKNQHKKRGKLRRMALLTERQNTESQITNVGYNFKVNEPEGRITKFEREKKETNLKSDNLKILDGSSTLQTKTVTTRLEGKTQCNIPSQGTNISGNHDGVVAGMPAESNSKKPYKCPCQLNCSSKTQHKKRGKLRRMGILTESQMVNFQNIQVINAYLMPRKT